MKTNWIPECQILVMQKCFYYFVFFFKYIIDIVIMHSYRVSWFFRKYQECAYLFTGH